MDGLGPESRQKAVRLEEKIQRMHNIGGDDLCGGKCTGEGSLRLHYRHAQCGRAYHAFIVASVTQCGHVLRSETEHMEAFGLGLIFLRQHGQDDWQLTKCILRGAKGIRREYMNVQHLRQSTQSIRHPRQQLTVNGQGTIEVCYQMLQVQVLEARDVEIDHGSVGLEVGSDGLKTPVFREDGLHRSDAGFDLQLHADEIRHLKNDFHRLGTELRR